MTINNSRQLVKGCVPVTNTKDIGEYQLQIFYEVGVHRVAN